MYHSKELVFIFILMLVYFAVLFHLIITAYYIWRTPYNWPVFIKLSISCYFLLECEFL